MRVSTGAGGYTQYSLGVFSSPEAITGKFYAVFDLVYSDPKLSAPSAFTLNVRESGTSSSVPLTPSGFNTLASTTSSTTLKANSIYEFYLTNISPGVVSNITIYFIQD